MNPEGNRLGIYQVGTLLGKGGMGAVYRATSLEAGPAGPAGCPVALKVFHAHLVDEEQAYDRFRREGEVGMRIRHEHVVRTYDVGREVVAGERVDYIVLELIEGQTLAGLLADLGTVPEQLRFQIADQALDALDALHAHGIVHRDIKPENIVITPDHRVLLMDLGVARIQAAGQTLTQAGNFVGSLTYAAPEQFRPEEEAIGPATDLYAFGLVLFELATGRNPFALDTVHAIIQAKLQAGAPSPRSLNPDVDAFWNEVIVAATRTNAADRFASAAEMRTVLREGEASAWWRAREATVGRSVAEPALRRLRLEREVPLVGRADALALLRGAWERARSGGSTVLLGGPSGVGKSRLLYEFLEHVAADGGPSIAAGRCVGSGGRSYQPFVEALQDLLMPTGAGPAERRRSLLAWLGTLLADTPGVVPQFADFLLGGIQPGVEGAFSKDALLAACARVFARLAAERPMILVIEDLQLAGAESLELFRYLARCVPGNPILLVGACSDDEVEEGTPLHALVSAPAAREIERMDLAPLDDAGVEDLVRAVVRRERTVRALARPLYERGDGIPFVVLELLSQLRADGALVPHPDGLELVRPLDGVATPRTVHDIAAQRLGRLDDEQRETLEVAAVLGYEFDSALLSGVLEQPRILLLRRLAVLERKHRLLVSSGRSGFRFASRVLFEAVYAGISPSLRDEYHGLVADRLLTQVKADGAPALDRATSYALLRHLVGAGRALEAEPYLEAALDHLAASFHASHAAPFLERVAIAFERGAPAKRFRIAMRLWTFYELLGSRPDQMRVLEQARELADRIGDPSARARVHGYRAGSYWYEGDFVRAAAEARTAMDLAREAGDRAWEATCHHTLGAVAFRRGEPEAAAVELREALRIRREVHDRRGEASTLQALALVMPLVGQEADVLATMEESLRAWREVGERRGEAAVLMNLGNHLVDECRFEEGLKSLELAIARHRETGAVVSEAMALANLGRAHHVLGDIERARSAWDRALRLFVEIGDPHGETLVQTMLGEALATYGEPAEARAHLEAAVELATRKGAKSRLVGAHRELGRLLHGSGHRAEGWVHLEKALSLEGETKNVTSRVATLGALAEAALADGDHARAEGYLREALPDARKGVTGTAALMLGRLARANLAAGRAQEATELAKAALELLEASGPVSPLDGPEIYCALAETLGDATRREELLGRAHALTEERARRISDLARRERFLTTTRSNLRLLATKGGGP